MRLFTGIFLLLICNLAYSQVYTEKQTRHRFAQLNLGVDFQSSFGGSTKYLDQQGKHNPLNLSSSYSPRFLIGGTHFGDTVILYWHSIVFLQHSKE